MKPEHALIYTLARRFLNEFIPGPLREKLKGDWAEAERLVAADPSLHNWINSVDSIEAWHGLRETPAYNPKVLYGISEALFNDQSLKIRYLKDGESNLYLVHPLGLIKREQVFYLVAIFDGFTDPRLLPLHRMTMAYPQGRPRRIPPDFNLADYLNKGLPFECDGDEKLEVELLFEETVYTSLIERPPRGAKVESPHDGWFRVTGTVPNNMELRWWLLDFNEKVRILKPEQLVHELQNGLFDRLTDLLGRKATEEHLDRLLAAGQRNSAPLAVIMADVDHFKAVNTDHGHEGGDRVLKEVARRLKKECRTMDVVGRWGGEEFLIILPDTEQAEALAIAERLREAVAATPIVTEPDHSASPSLPVTISIGVCWVPPEDLGSDKDTGQKREIRKADLINQADQALYKAKNNGRNRVASCKMNSIDSLTGLLRRREIMDWLFLAAVLPNNQPLAVLMADIDHLLLINDAHGHARGDVVLMEVASRLKKECRTMDVVGRWGGDEFLIILPDTEQVEALVIANRLCEAVAATPIWMEPENLASPSQSVTISIGVCWVPPEDLGSVTDTEQERKDRKEKLINDADKALCKAKNNGRNRVEMS
jgi:diguanylate cyclase (GGDEF)-like protein